MRVIRIGASEVLDGEHAACLLLIVRSAAKLVMGGVTHSLSPNTMLMTDGTIPLLGFDEVEKDASCCIRFEINEQDADEISRLGLCFNCPVRLTDVSFATSLIKIMTIEMMLRSPRCEELTTSLMRALLIKLSDTVAAGGQERPLQPFSYAAKLTALREKIYATPQEHWTIERMCREMNISRSHLHRLYIDTFGVTCYTDVLNSKVEHAKHLLSSTALSIHNISERCAFDNAVSFMRCFKKYTGMTPTQYRAGNFRK